MNTTTTPDDSVYLISYIGILMSCLEVFENLMVVVIIFTFKKLCRTPHIYFVLFLSLSDTLQGFGLISKFCTSIYTQKQNIDARFCVATNVIAFIALLSSCGQTSLICLERFRATCKRPISLNFSRRRRKIYVFINWLISSVLVLILFVVIPPDFQNVPVCSLRTVYDSRNRKVISLIISMYFLVPLIFVIVLYIGTAYRISTRLNGIQPTTSVKFNLKHNELDASTSGYNPNKTLHEEPASRKPFKKEREETIPNNSSSSTADKSEINENPNSQTNNSPSRHSNTNDKAKTQQIGLSSHTKRLHLHKMDIDQHVMNISGYSYKMQRAFNTVTVIIVTFIITMLPLVLILLVDSFSDVPAFASVVCYILVFLNSVTNPLIYAWRLPEFRKSINCCANCS